MKQEVEKRQHAKQIFTISGVLFLAGLADEVGLPWWIIVIVALGGMARAVITAV